MWNAEQTEFCVVELAKLGTVRGLKLDPRALLVWAEALSVYGFDYVMRGIQFLKTEWPDDFLTVPLIIEAAGGAQDTPLGKWWESEQLTQKRGAQLGIPAMPGESWASWRARLTAAGDQQKRQAKLIGSGPIQAALEGGRLRIVEQRQPGEDDV